MEKDVQSMAGLVLTVLLLGALLGSCAGLQPRPVPVPEVPCQCTTDIDCETRCGGEFTHGY